METKHTPGPWAVFGEVGLQIAVSSVAMPGLNLNVAHVAGIRNGEGHANAHLIAAAPDLLDALRKMLLCCYDEELDDQTVEAVEAARTAIAKATRAAIVEATGDQA